MMWAVQEYHLHLLSSTWMSLLHKYYSTDIVGLSSLSCNWLLVVFFLLLRPHPLGLSHSVILRWILDSRVLTGGRFSVSGLSPSSSTAVMFFSILLRPGLDGITLFPLMTVKTVADTEGTAGPHAAPQLLKHLMHAHTHTHWEEAGRYFFQVLWDSGILNGVFVCVLLHNTADVLALSRGYNWPVSLIKGTVTIHRQKRTVQDD